MDGHQLQVGSCGWATVGGQLQLGGRRWAALGRPGEGKALWLVAWLWQAVPVMEYCDL